MRPRWTGGSPGRWCPVINRMTRSPAFSARSRAISIAFHARSRLSPCKSTMRSGWIEPELSFRSHVPSSVWPMGADRRRSSRTGRWQFRFGGTDGGAPPPPPLAVPSRSGEDFRSSRDSGRMVAVTRAQSSASSGLSARDTGGALRHQDQGDSIGGHPAGDLRRLGPVAPEGVEPVCALDRAARVLRDPEAVGLWTVEREEDRRAQRNELGVRRNGRAR